MTALLDECSKQHVSLWKSASHLVYILQLIDYFSHVTLISTKK